FSLKYSFKFKLEHISKNKKEKTSEKRFELMANVLVENSIGFVVKNVPINSSHLSLQERR
ncbi:MAG TPA: hypothetical protein DDW20_02540, partial [Firmicutes bacterium]|nr:hypothetical protein [Bacillota bacterium]